tara:strand:+ start:1810 stop:2208 length:399 start_codon:yes stop_codon:yes gene_type:complete
MADITTFHTEGQSIEESLGILTGAGGTKYLAVANYDASGTATVPAGGTVLNNDALAFCTFNLGSGSVIRAITVLETDGDGFEVINVTTDADVTDAGVINVSVGTTVFGRWAGHQIAVFEGTSIVCYMESQST